MLCPSALALASTICPSVAHNNAFVQAYKNCVPCASVFVAASSQASISELHPSKFRPAPWHCRIRASGRAEETHSTPLASRYQWTMPLSNGDPLIAGPVHGDDDPAPSAAANGGGGGDPNEQQQDGLALLTASNAAAAPKRRRFRSPTRKPEMGTLWRQLRDERDLLGLVGSFAPTVRFLTHCSPCPYRLPLPVDSVVYGTNRVILISCPVS